MSLGFGDRVPLYEESIPRSLLAETSIMFMFGRCGSAVSVVNSRDWISEHHEWSTL
jgi:hypothetical protein